MATKKAVKKKQATTTVKNFAVMGLVYRTTKPQLQKWEGMLPISIRIEREPKNPSDPNALAVVINDGRMHELNMKIGYLPRQVAEVFAAIVDEGDVVFGDSELIYLDPDKAEGEAKVRIRKLA